MSHYLFFPKGGFANQLIQYSAVLSFLKSGDYCSVYLDSFSLGYGSLVSQRSPSALLLDWFLYSCKQIGVYIRSYDSFVLSKLRYRLFTSRLFSDIFSPLYLLCDDFYQDYTSLSRSANFFNSFFDFCLPFYTLPSFSDDSISIHLRLGDYRSLGSTLPSNYYFDAISYYQGLFNPSAIYIFSDEPFIASHILSTHTDINCLYFSSDDPCLDILSLYYSPNLVISSSTFSWVPAFSSPKAISVVAPSSIWLPTNKNFTLLPY